MLIVYIIPTSLCAVVYVTASVACAVPANPSSPLAAPSIPFPNDACGALFEWHGYYTSIIPSTFAPATSLSQLLLFSCTPLLQTLKETLTSVQSSNHIAFNELREACFSLRQADGLSAHCCTAEKTTLPGTRPSHELLMCSGRSRDSVRRSSQQVPFEKIPGAQAAHTDECVK